MITIEIPECGASVTLPGEWLACGDLEAWFLPEIEEVGDEYD